MNDKPYIYAGNLSDGELIKWLEGRVLALKSLNWNREEQALLERQLSDAMAKEHPLTAVAHAGIVRPAPDSIPHHADHQIQVETPFQSRQKETPEQHPGGFRESIHPESQTDNHSEIAR